MGRRSNLVQVQLRGTRLLRFARNDKALIYLTNFGTGTLVANAQPISGISFQRFDVSRGAGSGGEPMQTAQNARLYRAIQSQQFGPR